MIDIAKDNLYSGEGVRCVFSKQDSTKTTFRIFKDDQSALNMAMFIAAQHSINTPDKLKTFLVERGFDYEKIEAVGEDAYNFASNITFK